MKSNKNLYQGVNAHLHSYFQSHGGWQGFHTNYISVLTRIINASLPAGYVVDTEQSLQIKERDPDTGELIRLRRPEPDLTIYQSGKSEPNGSSTLEATLSIPMVETLQLSEEIYLSAVVIYQLQEDRLLGKPVTQIELLSPTNKPPGEGFEQYRDKRFACLKSGLKMVEIDFLHETESPIGGIPAYREGKSFPYYIAISDPSPSIHESQTKVYGFSVDMPIPILHIPLSGKETVQIDFDLAYQQTFEITAAYSLRVNYEKLPENFNRYHDSDKQRIKAVMERTKNMEK